MAGGGGGSHSFFYYSQGSYHESVFLNQYVLLLFPENVVYSGLHKILRKKPTIFFYEACSLYFPLLSLLFILCLCGLFIYLLPFFGVVNIKKYGFE